jgi:quinol monooxygenase YgiN
MKRLTPLVLMLFLAAMPALAQSKQDMKTSTHSTEIIRYKVAPDQQAGFLKDYTEAGKHLQASKYCQGYEIIQGDEEPNNYIVIIYWTSKDDHLNGFRKSAEFGPFFSLVKQYYNNIEEMKHYVSKTTWKRE